MRPLNYSPLCYSEQDARTTKKIGMLPQEATIFVNVLSQTMEVFDEPQQQISGPSFASNLQLSVGDLFAWLLE
ncbi:MAG: hypothetical protein DSM107014_06260 [Gomphosphaeria aponina SAG 52.96 = DSM 107014]|uniref:Uncharacterized protein n=1 Tax=Gomphosphaeria aponina SAG 52.96 = DSM 107014 TaxID=1521640 RepID=A0A941JUT2_9CHRO|nr:hypothetical protein [Gomphosphaeria aponina SAG 52.96 = DSM 107014]